MPDRWPAEALQAQAVVARTYALRHLHKGGDFDLYSDTRSQVYGGIAAESQTASDAVSATAGVVVLHKGELADTFFFSSSGGNRTTAHCGAGAASEGTPSKNHRQAPGTRMRISLVRPTSFPIRRGRGYTPPDAPVERYVALLDHLGFSQGACWCRATRMATTIVCCSTCLRAFRSACAVSRSPTRAFSLRYFA